MYLVTKNPYAQPWDPLQFAAEPVPSWTEWERLWQLWDTVTRHMIPDEQLLAKPIKLRNACIFYLGHIPTFFDMKLTDATNGSPTEPGYYYSIFERGIDPDVENPEQCHAHSEVPNEWPALQDILSYQKRVRERVKKLYEEGMDQNAKIGRCLWLGYEHEAMHLETLLYMLIQSEKTLPPTGVPVPVWSVRADQAEKSAVPNEWITIPARNIVINLDDPENGSTYPRYYGWDIEKPARKAQVNTFAAKARPITIGEYAYYMVDEGLKEVPASWAISEDGVSSLKDFNREFKAGLAHSSALGSRDSLPMSFLQNKYVRTVFGAVPLADALTWPVSASYDELRGCAAYMGGRIPTLEEARSMYAHASELKCKSTQSVEERLGRTIPAVNSHLVNDGVEESPPSKGPQSGSAGNPQELFVNLKGCNVGFQNWHPTPIVEKGSGLCGQGDMGGVWEWTSTTLAKYDGYKPMPLYPAYSQDFFDGKHNIVLGGSWATVPRIAGRKTFINWYQRNYPYVWAGARVVKDI